MTRLRVILIALALPSVVLAISTAVGYAALGHPFDWAVAAEAGTAAGTTFLAAATLALAASTWQDVRASQKVAKTTASSLELAQTEREERVRPALIGTVVGVNLDLPQSPTQYVTVRLHNVGGGVAVRLFVWVEFADLGDATETKILPILLTGESLRFDLDFDTRIEGSLEPEDLRVRGTYNDRLGRAMPSIIDWKHDPLESGL